MDQSTEARGGLRRCSAPEGAAGWAARLVLAPVSLFYLGAKVPADLIKLGLLSLLVTGFFLFTAGYYFPGGANHFTAYAQALADGGTLPPSIAQRDAGFPMLLWLSGYTYHDSLIGVTLFHALFALVMPLLIYWVVAAYSRVIAFYAGLASVVCLAPVLFMKWVHHDQTYVFFLVLTTCVFVRFIQSGRIALLYGFLASVIGASFSRPAGNVLFPVFLLIGLIWRPRQWVHYVIVTLVFVAALVGYERHRYQIFDMAHQETMPSYTGQQVFYNAYINSADYGVKLSPDVGPNMASLDRELRKKLKPTVRDAPFLANAFTQWPEAFADEYISRYTPDELIERIYDEPNYEYYMILSAAHPDDERYLLASIEITKAHPLYVLEYGLRNLTTFLFWPGYAHTRHNAAGFGPIGLNYPLSASGVEVTGTSARAAREVGFEPLSVEPDWINNVYARVARFWKNSYWRVVNTTSVLMVIAWLAVILIPASWIARSEIFGSRVKEIMVGDLAASITVVSLGLLYNAAVTALFAEPDFRYHHFIILLRILLAAYGVVVVTRAIAPYWEKLRDSLAARGYGWRISLVRSKLRNNDLWSDHFSDAPRVFAALATATAAVFGAWAWFMLAHT